MKLVTGGMLTAPLNIRLRVRAAEALECLGIKSDMSVGYLGTGVGAYANRYSKGGQRMTHNEVFKAWQKAGIMVITKPIGGNVYELNGKKISRGQALDYLKENFKLRNF